MRTVKFPHWKKLLVLFLAAMFTVGLTFATLELPYRADRFLQEQLNTPEGDSHANEISQFKAELFIAHYRLRLLGYVCFGATLLMIILGFASRRSGFAAIGAMAFMLPVFAQFASVMFFLAGLGFLNVLWIPMLDLSFETQELGRVIRAPYDLLAWVPQQFGLRAYWPIVLLFIGGGLLLFFLGTSSWLLARARKQHVADFWVYRISRHPQYLGWILWSYGIYLLLMRGIYPKRSWGIDASWPWLLSTMVIISVALLEELQMTRRYGEAYEAYRRKVPFLFPVPRFVSRLFSTPFRVFFKKHMPERRREVVLVIAMYTLLLVGVSAFLYGSGLERTRRMLLSAEAKRVTMEELAEHIRETPNAREKYSLAIQLASFGEAAQEHLLALLRDERPEVRIAAAEQLRRFSWPAAMPALIVALEDSVADVRGFCLMALAKIGSADAEEPMLGLLQDPEEWVRREAMSSLARMGVEEVIGPAIAALETSGEWSRITCIDVLGTLEAQEAVPALIEQLRDERPRVRRATAVALLKIGSPHAREALERASRDDDWETRIYAAEALEHITEQN